ncbi:cell wall hydrolase [Ferrovibrio sp.]|uniref:cell wall hydrolase n=1 Tax=Ferrovibrio sp. TaxID=1917215 RepID=UPI0035AE4328
MTGQTLVPLSQIRDFHTTSMPASDIDSDIGARTIMGEASGETFEGKVAVAWTFRNRVTVDLWGDRKPDWWGECIADVCLKPWQYTCWKDHNAERIKRATLSDVVFQDCMLAMLCVVKGLIPDPTAGSTHYYNPKIIKTPPAWALGRTPACIIGNHHFFNGVEPGAPGYRKV